MVQLADVYLREVRICTKDMGLLLFLFFLPFAYPIVYSMIYNPEVVRQVPVVVLDRDRTAESRKLVRDFDATPQADIIGYAADMAEARRAIDSKKAFAIFEIPRGYASDLGSGKQVSPILYCETSLLLRYRELMIAATNISMEQGSSEVKAVSTDPNFPMNMSYEPMGNPTSGFDSFIMPGVLMLILQQAIILAIGMRGGASRERSSSIGYHPVNNVPSIFTTMMGQSLCYFTLLAMPAIWLVYFVPLIFHFPMVGNIWHILTFLLPYMLASMMMGFCVQALVSERESVFIVWVVTSIALLFLSGLTWPLYAIDMPWKMISSIFPSTWGIQGFIRLNGDGATLAQVSGEYMNLWVLCIAYAGLAYILQRLIARPRARLAQIVYLSQKYDCRS